MNITIFCGSKDGARPAYRQAAHQLGVEIAKRQLGLVYGGSSVGLMGAAADAALAEGGEVIGVIPKGLADLEISHQGLSELHVVETMHERKAMMTELAGAFVVLPGGIGTLDETFETLTWLQLGIHDKPLGLLNVENYYDQLNHFLDHQVSEGFVYSENRSSVYSAEHASDLIDQLTQDRSL